MNELIGKVEGWAKAKGILDNSTDVKQLEKTYEELAELQRALGKLELVETLTEDAGESEMYAEVRDELKDAYGDVLVTLIIAAKLSGIDLVDALRSVYTIISARKGVLVDGKFLKETE